MSSTQALLAEMKAFSEANGIALSTMALKAINDGKMPERLRRGGSVTLETAERIRNWMRVNGVSASKPEMEGEAA